MMRLAALLSLLATPTYAGLVVCNPLDEPASVAVGYSTPDGWRSEGWWLTQPGSCVTLIREDLTHRFYYWRAELKGGPLPDGPYQFCATSERFSIEGDKDCEARGYKDAAFNRLDTGGAPSFAFHLPTGS